MKRKTAEEINRMSEQEFQQYLHLRGVWFNVIGIAAIILIAMGAACILGIFIW